MFYLIFKNRIGEIKFSGDGLSPFSLTQITGLGLPEKNYQTRQYLDFDGQQTISSYFAPRTITISFDLKGQEVSALTAKLYSVLSEEGTLYVYSSLSSRRIDVNQISVDSFTGRSSCRAFTAQFVCDNPYFWDTSTVYEPCYRLINNLSYDSENESWNLDTPVVWGETSNDTIFQNTGDIKSYPIFTIYSQGDAEDSDGFEILRTDPNDPLNVIQRFSLKYQLSDGEKITLCFDPNSNKKRRFISSSTGANLLNYRGEDTSLSDFFLDCGDNRIIITNYSRGNTLSAYLSYENQYVEGVF